MERVRLNKRVLTTFGMIFSFATLPISGILLHETDQQGPERIKFLAMALHNVAALIFAASATLHMRYNGRQILLYLRDQKTRLVKHPKELAIAASALALPMLLAVLHVIECHW